MIRAFIHGDFPKWLSLMDSQEFLEGGRGVREKDVTKEAKSGVRWSYEWKCKSQLESGKNGEVNFPLDLSESMQPCWTILDF